MLVDIFHLVTQFFPRIYFSFVVVVVAVGGVIKLPLGYLRERMRHDKIVYSNDVVHNEWFWNGKMMRIMYCTRTLSIRLRCDLYFYVKTVFNPRDMIDFIRCARSLSLSLAVRVINWTSFYNLSVFLLFPSRFACLSFDITLCLRGYTFETVNLNLN